MTLSKVWKSATFLVACEISAYILSNSVRALNPQKSLNIELAAQSYSHRGSSAFIFPTLSPLLYLILGFSHLSNPILTFDPVHFYYYYFFFTIHIFTVYLGPSYRGLTNYWWLLGNLWLRKKNAYSITSWQVVAIFITWNSCTNKILVIALVTSRLPRLPIVAM